MSSQKEEEEEFISFEPTDIIQVEYVWIGGTGLDLRSKTRSVKGPIYKASQLPVWNFDGSSTGQAPGEDSEVYLKAIKIIPDPFRLGKNIIALCETFNPETNEPLQTNRRAHALRIFNNPIVKDSETWFGIEQEYTFFHSDAVTPLGWPKGGYPEAQGKYYCGVGATKVFGRKIVDEHYKKCLYSGIKISGINAEVMPGQWEFQVGPCIGIDSGDSLWLARYILERVAEKYNVIVCYDVKPIPGDWNGAGCHTNYSTIKMRSKDGYKEIINAIKKLKERHQYHMKLYGKNNEKRLTGKHETGKFHEFTYGVANRGASVRIPRQTKINGKGYFEDRRPGANMDPYDVTSMIAETTILYTLKSKL